MRCRWLVVMCTAVMVVLVLLAVVDAVNGGIKARRVELEDALQVAINGGYAVEICREYQRYAAFMEVFYRDSGDVFLSG